MLRRAGWMVNHKRVYRLYREEGLAVRTRRRGKRAAGVARGQLVERVWVRDCKGRYALLTVPIRAYPA